MKASYQKYIPFNAVPMQSRDWPNHSLTQAPVWCSVDLRDGNQALVDPMNLEEKLLLFKTLVDIGFKEIEVGFPSANETEYEILRTLIDRNLIPDDVTVQVLVQAREHLIRKTFDAIRGAKNVILHFYNSTSTLQRKVVFGKDMDGIVDIAVSAAKLIDEMSEGPKQEGTNLRFEYSPESFSGTEMDNAVMICDKVLEALHASAEHPVILNLPSTVEGSTPNGYADQIEYFCKHLPQPERAIISVHPHNDRGTAVAAAEMAMLAGAKRVEGTLFGNGERTGNVDIMTLALNLFTQGVDPELDFSRMNDIRGVYEKVTKMQVHPRHPYAGDLVFTAFSGSHQDAINKGMEYMRKSGSDYWEIPYLPIDPADLGRQYEPIIRINSQSGKGGAAYILKAVYGFDMPKGMHPEFGALVKTACDQSGREMTAEAVFALFEAEYLNIKYPYNLKRYKLSQESGEGENASVAFDGVLRFKHQDYDISGNGNGPIDAFYKALSALDIGDYEFLSYDEHAATSGSDSKAAAYIALKAPDGKAYYGVGVDSDISIASIKAVICAINRSKKAG